VRIIGDILLLNVADLTITFFTHKKRKSQKRKALSVAADL
jgi:hypothetical protein